MKPQDLLFIVVFLILLFLRKPRLFIVFGLGSLVLSVPFFVMHVFFTAQRLVYYAAGFLIFAILLLIINELTGSRNVS